MNKIAVLAGAVVLLAGGYYLGTANRPEPTVIKVPSTPKAEFVSEGSSEVAAVSSTVSVRAWETPTSGELIVVKDGESIQEAVAAAQVVVSLGIANRRVLGSPVASMIRFFSRRGALYSGMPSPS